MAEAARDQNRIPTLMAVSSVDGTTPVPLYADPTTHRLYVDLPGGSGTVTSVSVVSANGFAGTVATATTTPAITLSTTITGLLKGNGTAISAASAGTDYTTPTGTENLQNKTLDNTNTVSLKDTLFTLQDEGDTTKQAKFQLSGITTATTRTYTLPNTSATIVVNSGNQTIYGTTSFQSVTDGNSNARVFYTGSTGGGAEIRGHNGFSATLPIYSFWYNNYTGLGNPAFNVLSFIVNAVELGRFSGSNFTVTNGIELGHASDTTLARVSAGVVSIEGNNIVTNTSSPTLATITTTGNIELGHASDTTLSRSSAGVLAVEGVNVLTTATGLPLSGGTMTGSITLGENTSIALDPAGSADGKYTGITVTGTAGYTQAFGDLVYLDPTDSRWEAADANAASAADGDARGMLGMVVVAGTDGNSCTILLNGIIRADAKFPAFTVNNPIYVSETAGSVTQTQPTTTDVVIRIVGAALTADEMYFNPDWTWTTHT